MATDRLNEKYYTKQNLNAVSNPSGASQIGIEDSGDYYTSTTVEDVLQEIAPQLANSDTYVARTGADMLGELNFVGTGAEIFFPHNASPNQGIHFGNRIHMYREVDEHVVGTDVLRIDGNFKVEGTSFFRGEMLAKLTGDNVGLFKIFVGDETDARFEITNQGDIQFGGGSAPIDVSILRSGANTIQVLNNLDLGAYQAPTVKLNGTTGFISVKDGIAEPDTDTGFVPIYVDTADGLLKYKTGSGTVRTISYT